MHASVPLIVVKRTMKLDRLIAARTSQANRPSWAAILAKAFSIVARDEPWLRTFYLKWPWPRFFEVQKSVATIAAIRESAGEDAVVFAKIVAPDELSLQHVHAHIQGSKDSPLDDVQYVKRVLLVTRQPLPIRRLVWWLVLNIGRLRANNFGTFGITSIASKGSEIVVARTPGPSLISFGVIRSDCTMDIFFHWDHRIYDGVLVARILQRLEDVLNGDIADELSSNRQAP